MTSTPPSAYFRHRTVLLFVTLLCSLISVTVARHSRPHHRHHRHHHHFDNTRVIEANLRLFGRQYDCLGKAMNCGGTVVSTRHVLTAAHCFFAEGTCCVPSEALPKCKRLYVGTVADALIRNDSDQQQPFSVDTMLVELDGTCLQARDGCDACRCAKGTQARTVRVARIFIPSDFVSSRCTRGDIALVELAEPVAPRRVAIAARRAPMPSLLSASGYGRDPTRDVESTPDDLMTVNVSMQARCPPGDAAEDALCGAELWQNVCEGDSGVALSDMNRTVYGVVSYGTPCRDIESELQERGLGPNCTRKDVDFKGGVYTSASYWAPFLCAAMRKSGDARVTKGCVPSDDNASKQPFFWIGGYGPKPRLGGHLRRFEAP